MTDRRLFKYIDALIAGRRPPEFQADPEDLEVLRAAIALREARPGDAIPNDQFVSDLYEKLADQEGSQSAPITRLHPLHRGRVILAGAAATIVLLAGTVVATENINHSSGTPIAAKIPNPHDLRTGTFETADNQITGQIVAYRGHPSWVFMNIAGSNYSGPIVCKLQVENGMTVAVGGFNLHSGKGEFLRNISVDIANLRGAKLVTSNGSIVASATFA